MTLLLWSGNLAAPPAARPAVKARRADSSRLNGLEARLLQQEALLEAQHARIADLERVTQKEFEIVHYNVLADQAGSNLNPWFLYGGNVTAAERAELTRRFYHGDVRGRKDSPNKGWPDWALGILSDERRAAIEEYLSLIHI